MVVFDIKKTLGDASGQHPFMFPRFGPCVGTKTQNVPGNGAGAGPAGPAGPAPRTARRARATAGAKRRYLWVCQGKWFFKIVIKMKPIVNSCIIWFISYGHNIVILIVIILMLYQTDLSCTILELQFDTGAMRFNWIGLQDVHGNSMPLFQALCCHQKPTIQNNISTPEDENGTWEYTSGNGKSSSKPSFSCSMLIILGVKQPCWSFLWTVCITFHS